MMLIHRNKKIIAQSHVLMLLCAVLVLLNCFEPSRLAAQFRPRQEDSTSRVRADSLIRADSTVNYEVSRNHYLQRQFVGGATIGAPAGINLAFGGYYDRFGALVEAGAFSLIFVTIEGFQTELNYVLTRRTSSLLQCSLIYTQTKIFGLDDPQPEWSRAFETGLGLNAGGWFFEVAAGHALKQPGLINSESIQLGYIH